MTPTRHQGQPLVPERIAAGTTSGTYKPTWAPLRPNADQHESVPSRHDGRLYYRDGKVVAA